MAVKTSKNLRNKVIYQIFTRNYKEGTFKAIEADLQRIKDLGVDIIYLLPIHPNGEINRKGSIGSPYAVKDYREIDPRQGTMEDCSPHRSYSCSWNAGYAGFSLQSYFTRFMACFQ